MPKGIKGFQKGHISWAKGKKFPGRKLSKETKNKMSITAKARGFGKWTLGKKQSEDTKNKKRGENNYNWKGGRFIDKNGYVLILVPGHYKANKKGYVLEHRVVIEAKLGRVLLKNENVHHINGVRDDNRVENLELWSTSQPSGQRIEDKVKWAKEILELYT